MFKSLGITWRRMAEEQDRSGGTHGAPGNMLRMVVEKSQPVLGTEERLTG